MSNFIRYRRSQIAELRPYEPGEPMDRISVSVPDREAGSPKPGDMIARNPKNHDDQWLVAAAYFADNFEPIEDATPRDAVVSTFNRCLGAIEAYVTDSTKRFEAQSALGTARALTLGYPTAESLRPNGVAS